MTGVLLGIFAFSPTTPAAASSGEAVQLLPSLPQPFPSSNFFLQAILSATLLVKQVIK